MHRTRQLLTGTGAVVAAAALATSIAAPLASDPAAAAKKPAKPKQFFHQSLKGSKKTKAFTATKAWTLAYNYNCGSTKKGSFTLYLHPAHGHKVLITKQSGLGGGGARHEKHAGRFYLGASTKCKWTVTATHK